MTPTPFVDDPDFRLYVGDALGVLRELPDASVDCCVTSPPYLDTRPEYPSPTLEEFESIFAELRRVVVGQSFVNVGRLFRAGVEYRWWVALIEAAERAGWAHLDTRVWVKANGNPIHGQVFADRHEYLILLGRAGEAPNVDAIREPYAEASLARLRRGWVRHVGVKGDAERRSPRRSEPNPLGGRPSSYVVIDTGREKGNEHPAPMPLELAASMVALVCPEGGSVLDPFAGSGTTALAARNLGRSCVAIEIDETYARRLIFDRTAQQSLLAEEPA